MIADKLRPQAHHRSGITDRTKALLLSGRHNDMGKKIFDNICGLIDKTLEGKGCKVDEEQQAADFAAHLIIDAAWVFEVLHLHGINLGAFPYDEYAVKLFPDATPA